jgi:hypothetical protein
VFGQASANVCSVSDEDLVGTIHDLLGSHRSGPFPIHRVWRIPAFLERNNVASRHWNPPGVI